MDLSLSALMSLLPPGLAVGPSLSCGGAVGLWWVGLPLEAGSELPTGRSVNQDSTNHAESTGSEKVPVLPLFLRFACRAQSSSQQNLSLQTQVWPDRGSRTVQIRTTKSVHTGAELLLPRPRPGPGPGPEPDPGGRCEKREETQTPEEKSEQTPVNSRPNEAHSAVPVLSESESEEQEDEEGAGDKMAAAETETAPPTVWTVLDSLCSPVRKPTARKTGEDEPCRASDKDVAVATSVRRQRQRRYPCETCGMKFTQKSHLDKHRFTHSQRKEFSCEQCGKTYSSKCSFNAHQLMHEGKRPFPCPLCPKAYGLKRDLKDHLVLHSGLRPFRCSDCGRGFTRGPSLKVHQLISCEKLQRAADQVPLQCSVCSRTFPHSDALTNHMKSHKLKHRCEECGKRFRLKGKLVAHMKTHRQEAQSLSCSLCGRSFSCWQERQRHLQEHRGNSDCLCSVCGKELKGRRNLRKHEQLHTNKRSHPCPHCDKGYVSSSKLRVHLRSAHSSEKPFVCHCGAAYALRQSLTRHQALNHGPDPDQDQDPEPEQQQQPITEQSRGEGAEPEEPLEAKDIQTVIVSS